MKKYILTKRDLELLKRALQYIKPDKGRFVFAFLLILAGITLTLIQPLLWAKVITAIFGKDYRVIFINLILFTILFIAQTVITFLQNYNTAYLNEHIAFYVKKDMYDKILNLPVKAFDDMRVGDFISRLQGDAGAIAGIMTNQLLSIVIDVLKVIVLGAAVIWMSLPLAAIVLAVFPLSLYIFLKYGRIMREKNNALAKLADDYLSDVQQTLTGIREVKGMGIKNRQFVNFLNNSGLFKDKKIDLSLTGGKAQSFAQGINFLSQIAVMAAGVFLIFRGHLTIETFIAFSSYSGQFSDSLRNIVQLNSNLQTVMTSLERIFGIMDNLNYTKEQFGDKTLILCTGSIRFQDVVFGYDKDKQVLNGISFEIAQKKRVALVGRSGCGKSTLFYLLQKFYTPRAGAIYIDGIDISHYTEQTLRSHIAVVNQNPFLFPVSIRENLLLANPDASDEDLQQACAAAFIDEFIRGLPLKYNTLIGENGITLSGGQKQRIAIARACLKKSEIILFDEATSSLDNESQYNIKRAIDQLAVTHTVVVIAHRLMTIIEAEQILVMDNGVITAAGTHKTLLESCPVYRQLYKTELDTLMANQEEELTHYA